jgi:hypothetical protein
MAYFLDIFFLSHLIVYIRINTDGSNTYIGIIVDSGLKKAGLL